MTHLKDILVDFKRCFVEGEFQLDRYDNNYMVKAEQHALNEASSCLLYTSPSPRDS